MKYSAETWAEKRKRGLPRFLAVEGVLMTGAPFAVIMQGVGYLIFGGNYETFGAYFGSGTTWTTFFFHATLFGLIMGFINWRRNEKMFAATNVLDP